MKIQKYSNFYQCSYTTINIAFFFFCLLILNTLCRPVLWNVSSLFFCRGPNQICPIPFASLSIMDSLILVTEFPVFWCFPFGNGYSSEVFEGRMTFCSLEGLCTFFCFNSTDFIVKHVTLSEDFPRLQLSLYE